MKLIPQGDHYVWYCEWCDTRNLTLWTRVAKNEVCCAACHKKFTAYEDQAAPKAYHVGASLLPC